MRRSRIAALSMLLVGASLGVGLGPARADDNKHPIYITDVTNPGAMAARIQGDVYDLAADPYQQPCVVVDAAAMQYQLVFVNLCDPIIKP